MVLGVCRRVLHNWHDAEDAFQAAFLILARKAASVRWHDSAGGWLLRVAYHLALKMKSHAADRRTFALPTVAAPESGGPIERELHLILDEELSSLPEKYRLPLLLCHYEGKTRAEAARQLGWKEGAVKIRLERGRQLLRNRLARRGFALSTVLVGSLLSQNGATAMPAALAAVTAAAARSFALGQLSASVASQSSTALALGVLKTMMMNRFKFAILLVLTISVALFGVGLAAYRAFAQPPKGAALEPRPVPQTKQAEVAPVAKAPEKPLRVLLFTSAPTREYQFVRTLFVKLDDKKEAELSICLQSGARGGVVQDVPAERLLKKFPTRLTDDDKKDKDDKYGNLAHYDVIIAFDPDWTKLSEEQGQLLEKWVGQEGRGLIFIAGPINTLGLVRPGNARRVKPILDVLPVRLKDSRLLKERNPSRPWPLAFPAPEKFLKLDPNGKGDLAGWSEFFFGKQRDDWQKTTDQPERGFYAAYPVQSVKPAATVIATFRDPEARIAADGDKTRDLPYLVAMSYGKGKSIYLGSGETWRLRQFDSDFSDRLWTQLTHYAASRDGAAARPPGARAPAITPEQRQATDNALKWLARAQQGDGHWEGGDSPVTLTALSGMALLMQGSTITEGEHATSIRKPVDWLMARSQPDGLIGNRDKPVEAAKELDGHAHALLFLASVYGDEEDAERRRRLEDVLTRAVKFATESQTSEGGWGHRNCGPAKEKEERADIGVTVLQLQALLAARSVGIAVPKKPVDAAWTYLEKNVAPSSPAAIVSAAVALAAGGNNTLVLKKWLKGAKQSAPALDPKSKHWAEDDRDLFAYTLMASILGDEGYAKLFPETKPDERITWKEWRTKVFDYLLKTQNADGSWKSEAGKVYPTAVRLAILQLDYGVVPIYPR
jgi:RNA polymerase sigma factor (sigma-70 family)